MVTFTRQHHSLLSHGNRDLLTLLGGLAAHHGKHYCYPAYNTLQRLYGAFFGRPISHRTIARHMRQLEAEGLLTRQRRHTRDKAGHLVLRSTLYRLTTQALRVLASARRKVAQVVDSLAVTLPAKYLRPSLSYHRPGSERAPAGEARAPSDTPPPVDNRASPDAIRRELSEMRRVLDRSRKGRDR